MFLEPGVITNISAIFNYLTRVVTFFWSIPEIRGDIISWYKLSIGVVSEEVRKVFVFEEITFSYAYPVPNFCRYYTVTINGITSANISGPTTVTNFTATAPGKFFCNCNSCHLIENLI